MAIIGQGTLQRTLMENEQKDDVQAVRTKPTEEEAYNFFTFNCDPPQVDKTEKGKKKQKPKVTTSIENQQIKPLSSKDEGLSVVSTDNKNILKTEEGKICFGEYDRISALPDPIKKYSTWSSLVHMEEDLDPALQTEYKKALKVKDRNLNIVDGADLEGYYQLDVDVSGLIFSHHPLFSHEHVLGARLVQLYDQYLIRQHNNLTGRLTNKLKRSRKTLHMLLDIECERSLNQTLRQKISVYVRKVRNTRKRRDIEQEKDRTLLKRIVQVWKEIKALRELQEFTSTTYKLCFRRETVDLESDEREHEEEILAEVEDLLAEQEENYMRDWAVYQEQLEEWKMKSEDTTEEVPLKPERPELSNSDSLEQWVREKASRIRRKPGEPILTPKLSASGTITATKLCPRAERARRKDLSRRRLFIKIFCNEKEVSQTDSRALNDDFRVHFGEIFNLHILNCPESITLQVFEKTKSSCSLLAQVFAPVPEPSLLTSTSPLEEVVFSSNQQVMFDHEGVGSGVPISFVADGSSSQTLLTSGKLWCCASWVIGEDGTPLAPPVSQPAGKHSGLARLDAVAPIAACGVYDTKIICDWAAQSQPDPNNLNGASATQLLKAACSGEVSAPEFFRLERLQEEFNFVTDEEIEKSKRFRLLRLRDQEVPEFVNSKCVPAHESEVPDDVFQDYEERVKSGVVVDAKEHLKSRKALVAQNLQKIRDSIIQGYELAKPRYRLSDLVRRKEDKKLSIRYLGNILPKLFEPKPRLKPRRKERKKLKAKSLSDGDVKLLVKVILASDIPVRKGPSKKLSPTANQGTDCCPRQVQVRPFVEVSFQQTVLQTTTADGPNPCWNEELQLPFSAPNGDYSTASLQSVKDKILISIFDERSAESDKDKGIQLHVEKHWLGSVQIPFSTIYSQFKIDGTVRLNTPATLLGYTKQRCFRRNGGPCTSCTRNEGTFIKVFITLEPQLVPRKSIREKFDSQEDERLLQASYRFEENAAQDFPDRPCITTVIDLKGETVFITRFIQPLNPPRKCLEGFPQDSLEAMTRVARFVSLIPSLRDQDTVSRSYNIWSTCDQFLTFLAGDQEHAVLLCNYFLYMRKKAWVIIGSALPEGPTAYVLTLDQRHYLIWNPRTGQCYSQYDTFCPLQTIGCLVNAENVWFNIQQHPTPMETSFDITMADKWKPFFSPSFPQPGLSSVQTSMLLYRRTSKAAAKELQDRIEKILKEKVMEWRPHQPTRWNRSCTFTLKQFLPDLEECVEQDTIDVRCQDLQKMLGDYEIFGPPLRLPFSGLQSIIEAVYRTGVHNIQAPSVEFALAVHVHTYPNDVLSVWVHLVSLFYP